MRGFTLLEVLISIVLLGSIMAVVYGAYTSNVAGILRARHESETWQISRVVMDRISKDLESSYTGIKNNMNSVNGTLNGRPADRISFTTLAHLALYETDILTDLCQVEYYLKETKGKDSLTLVRSEKIIVGKDYINDSRIQEMCDSIVGMEIDFQDDRGATSTEWVMKQGDLPSLIRIRMRLEDGMGGEYEFITSVHPGVTGFY